MPFGMVNSSASFVRLMKMILSDLEDFADAFIDDNIIFSETCFDHLKHITEVLSVLRRAGLTAKPSQCMFAFQQIEFLAHSVGNGEVHPTQEKIAAIQTFQPPPPKNQKARALFYWGHRILPQVYPPFCKQISCFNRSYWKRYAKQSQMD